MAERGHQAGGKTTVERRGVGHAVEREKRKQVGRGGRRRAEVGEEGGGRDERERRGATANEERRRADECERGA